MFILQFIKDFILPKQFKNATYWVRIKVIALNLMMPLSLTTGSLLLARDWGKIYKGVDTLPEIWMAFGFLFILTILYTYFLITKKLDEYFAVYTTTNILYFSVSYYFVFDTETSILWMFVVSLIIFFFNKLKYAIINFSLFYLLIMAISLLNFEELSEHFFTPNTLIMFMFLFTVYSIILVSSELFKQKIINTHRRQEVELKENNKALSNSLDIQEKIYAELKEKEIQEIENSRDLLAIINNTSDLIWVVDEKFVIKIYNKSYEESVKRRFKVDELTDSIENIFKKNGGEQLLDFVNSRYLEVKKAKKSIVYYDDYVRDGTPLYFVTEMTPVFDTDGEVKGISSFSKDVTSLKVAQKEKEELLQKNSSIIDSIGEVVYEYNFINNEFTWNDAVYPVLGLTVNEMPQSQEEFILRIHKHNKEAYEKELDYSKEIGIHFNFEFQFLTFRGYTWVQIRANIHYDDEGKATRMIGVLSDISEKKNSDTKRLTAVVQGVDLERKRIAGDIHDGLGQTLIAASLMLNSLNETAKENLEAKDFEKHQLIEKMINDAIQESRELSHNLMPKSLEDYGIIPSLKSLSNKINSSKRINIEFHSNLSEEQRIPIDVEVNLYRVTQEALNNIIKHSNASKVTLQLLHYNREITYTIEDNGNGFTNKKQEGLGLQNIKNRILSIGGVVQFDSHANYGTIITIEVDLKQEIFKQQIK